jgi:hypothetical protein
MISNPRNALHEISQIDVLIVMILIYVVFEINS